MLLATLYILWAVGELGGRVVGGGDEGLRAEGYFISLTALRSSSRTALTIRGGRIYKQRTNVFIYIYLCASSHSPASALRLN